MAELEYVVVYAAAYPTVEAAKAVRTPSSTCTVPTSTGRTTRP